MLIQALVFTSCKKTRTLIPPHATICPDENRVAAVDDEIMKDINSVLRQRAESNESPSPAM